MVGGKTHRIYKRSEAISEGYFKRLRSHFVPHNFAAWENSFAKQDNSSVPGILILLLLLIQLPCHAALDWAFLGIPQGARETSMGETGVSMPNNSGGVWWNPAHISGRETGLWIQSFRWISEGKGSYAGFIVPTSWGGMSAYYVNHGMEGFEARDRPGESQGEFTLRQVVLAGGGAIRLPSNLALGVTYKQAIEIIQGRRSHRENILDIGLNWYSGDYSAGLVAVNLVFDEEADENLPLAIRGGMSYTHTVDDYTMILAYGGDLQNKSGLGREKEFKYINKLGFEVGWTKRLFGRIGFISGYDSRSVSFGLGVLVKENYQFDFAVVPTENDLGNTWKMGLGFRF